MWEDEANANGGKWVLTMKNNPVLLDRCWSWLTMALVGEELEEGDEICGAVVSLRTKVDRIQVWTRSKDDVERLNSIGKKLVKLLDVSEADGIGLEFQVRWFGSLFELWVIDFLGRSIIRTIDLCRTNSFRSNLSPTLRSGRPSDREMIKVLLAEALAEVVPLEISAWGLEGRGRSGGDRSLLFHKSDRHGYSWRDWISPSHLVCIFRVKLNGHVISVVCHGFATLVAA